MEAKSRSLNGQAVLEEDDYTAALSHIIARDFFPSLVQNATNDYRDALELRDPELINASVRRLEEIGVTPGRRFDETPYGGGPSDTPLRSASGEPLAKRPRIDLNLSLDNFQARYTSEDNSSFTEILHEENRKRKERYGWAWEAQKRVEAQRERMLADRERLLLEPQSVAGMKEKFRIEAPKPVGLIESAPKSEEELAIEKEAEEKAKLALAVLRSEEQDVDVMAPQKDTRSASVDTWSFKTRNSLMFAPDADVTPYRIVPNSKPDSRVIVHNSTRLVEHDDSDSRFRSASAPPSPTRSHINAAITGTPYRPRSPTINNFSLVPNLPSPTPEQLGPKAVKQLMTWGTLNATPRVISQTDDLPPPNTPFHIAKPTSREEISYKLANKASKSLRMKAGLMGLGRTPVIGGTARKGTMGPPIGTPRRSEAAGNLTPAARRLLDRTLGTAATRRAEAMDRVAGWESGQKRDQDLNRVRWTPTPSAGK
ncbi:hypothetical protein MIND_00496500 [Mycena indigotica]|uniref:Uncharacterized protein n=1 Tax=Mycena indigotica TaxID=2126181 RepID=A0A8H6SXP0_9AGAR|nr:uncharacterized protein MIND_00496500 [Mycena indigotica]KAF7307035.1 hypothetical protein MIND_00496500 [Mycena indigotica]